MIKSPIRIYTAVHHLPPVNCWHDTYPTTGGSKKYDALNENCVHYPEEDQKRTEHQNSHSAKNPTEIKSPGTSTISR